MAVTILQSSASSINRRKQIPNKCPVCGNNVGVQYKQTQQHLYVKHQIPFKVSIKAFNCDMP